MRAISGVVLAVSLWLLTGCKREALPESYGIYIRDGHTLTRLENDMPEERRRDFSQNSVLVIFDKRLSLMGLGGDPEKSFRILSRHYVRFHAVLERESAASAPVNILLRWADEFKAIGTPVACSIMPVKGQPDMIEIRPRQPLANGLYYADVDGERVPFGVGIGNSGEKESPYAAPMDGYTERMSADAPFSWNNWLAAAAGSGRDEKYSDTQRLDKTMDEFKVSFIGKLNDRKFKDTLKTLPALSLYYGQDFTNLVVTTMSHYAQAQLDDDPQVAVALANRVLAFSPENTDAKQVVERGKEAIEAWNDSQAQQRLAAAEKRDAWWNVAHRTNTVIATLPYYSDAWPNEKRAHLILTDTTIIDEWQEGWGQQRRADVWLGDIIRIEKSSRGRKTASGQSDKFAVVTIVTKDQSDSAIFGTPEDRDQAQEQIEKALADFKQKFDPASHTNSTVGTVRRLVESDSVAYAIDLIGHDRSPPIHVPANCRSWKWRYERDGRSFSVFAEDGRMLGNDSSSTVDRNSDVAFQSRAEDADKLHTEIVITFELD